MFLLEIQNDNFWCTKFQIILGNEKRQGQKHNQLPANVSRQNMTLRVRHPIREAPIQTKTPQLYPNDYFGARKKQYEVDKYSSKIDERITDCLPASVSRRIFP